MNDGLLYRYCGPGSRESADLMGVPRTQDASVQSGQNGYFLCQLILAERPLRYIAALCGSRRSDSRIRLRKLINTHQTGPSNSKALRRYRSERALRCEGPALSVKIGVKGGDITHDCGAHQWTSHAYGVV